MNTDKCHSEAKPKNLGVKDETLRFTQGDTEFTPMYFGVLSAKICVYP